MDQSRSYVVVADPIAGLSSASPPAWTDEVSVTRVNGGLPLRAPEGIETCSTKNRFDQSRRLRANDTINKT
jgi:hypothetical protein